MSFDHAKESWESVGGAVVSDCRCTVNYDKAGRLKIVA